MFKRLTANWSNANVSLAQPNATNANTNVPQPSMTNEQQQRPARPNRPQFNLNTLTAEMMEKNVPTTVAPSGEQRRPPSILHRPLNPPRINPSMDSIPEDPPSYDGLDDDEEGMEDSSEQITFIVETPAKDQPGEQPVIKLAQPIEAPKEVASTETPQPQSAEPVMERPVQQMNKKSRRSVRITIPLEEVAPQIREQISKFKRTRPPLTREKQEEKFEKTWAGRMAFDIEYFFKYNNQRLVRKDITVGEMEQKKARTWVLFLIFLQISVCLFYGLVVTYLIPRDWAYTIFAYIFGGYFALKLGSVILFVLRSRLFLPDRWTRPKLPTEVTEDGQSTAESILVCIPAYNEGQDAFLRTITSVTKSEYPKDKLYMFFIVDGNKANSFQNLMAVLTKQPFTEKVPSNERVLKHGEYDGVGWTVFLKEQNRGKRDSQWLFVEILRCMVFKPTYVLFVDSDTMFKPDSILYLSNVLNKDKSGKVAGVCGQIKLSNYHDWEDTMSNNIFRFTTVFIVLYQCYEYYFNQILSKQAEAAYGSVTCLPGAFSLFRRNFLEDIEAEVDLKSIEVNSGYTFSTDDLRAMKPQEFLYRKHSQAVPLTLSDFFSKKTIGIIDRNLYELGEDRTLTVRFLERGLSCMYEPRAVAYTECPDTLRVLMAQRRRWNNSTFVNLAMMLLKPKLWSQLKTLPVIIFTIFDFLGAYLLPANSIMLMCAIWGPAVEVASNALGMDVTAKQILFWWVVIQMVVISTTTLANSDMFYAISAFFSGCMMAFSLYWFVNYTVWNAVAGFQEDPANNWPLLVMIGVFPLLHFLVTLTKPLMFFTAAFYYFLLPFISITLPFYSFFHLDDFSWGNR